MLAGPARYGWVSRDVNQLISDWAGVHGWLPDAPYRPIGLLGAMVAWHGDLSVRPAAADMAREADELAAARARVVDQFADRVRAAAARAVGVAALGGPGHLAARAAAAAAARRATARRTRLVATDTARRDTLVRAARGLNNDT